MNKDKKEFSRKNQKKDMKSNMISTKRLKALAAIVGVGALVLLLNWNKDAISQPKTLIGNDVSEKQLIPIPIEDFEKPSNWKGVPTPYDPNRINSLVDIRFIDGKPGDLGDLPARKVFGVKFQFRYPGFNFVTLFPPVLKDSDGNPMLDVETQEKIGPAIVMPGRTRKVSVWVMSQGKDYTLEGYIRDWQGNTHRLKFGSLKYVGWRPLAADVPLSVPQAVGSYPQTKTMTFVKFIIRSTRKTSTEPVYIFFDQLKVLTNKFDVHFDGAEIDTSWGGKLSPVKGLLQATKPANK